MLAVEKKIINFLEKHLLLLTVLLITGIALLIRRQNIWYHTSDYIYYFDSHERNVQSVFYYLLVVLVGNVANIPLHGMKWIASLADFAVALLCVLIGKRELIGLRKPAEREKWKLVLIYAGCLFAPVFYVRGCVWAQIESLAMAFLLTAFYFYNYRKKQIFGVLFASIAAALYPFYIVPVAIFLLCSNKRDVQRSCLPAVIAAGALLLNIGSCFAVGVDWKQGLTSLVQWISFHPYTGELYQGVAEWLWQMIILGGYAAALLTGLSAFCRKRFYAAAVIVQVLIFVCYGMALGW